MKDVFESDVFPPKIITVIPVAICERSSANLYLLFKSVIQTQNSHHSYFQA